MPVVGVLALTPTGGKPAKCVGCFDRVGLAVATAVSMVAATMQATAVSFVITSAPFNDDHWNVIAPAEVALRNC